MASPTERDLVILGEGSTCGGHTNSFKRGSEARLETQQEPGVCVCVRECTTLITKNSEGSIHAEETVGFN